VGKWAVLGAVLVWLRHPAPLGEVLRVGAPEALLTLLVGALLLPLAPRLLPTRAPRAHLL